MYSQAGQLILEFLSTLATVRIKLWHDRKNVKTSKSKGSVGQSILELRSTLSTCPTTVAMAETLFSQNVSRPQFDLNSLKVGQLILEIESTLSTLVEM